MPFGYGERRAGARRMVRAVFVPAPVFTVQPSIGGTPRVGQTATGNNGTVTNGIVSTRRWLLNGSAIAGATGGTYVPVGGDAGGTLVYEVTASGAGGTTVASAAGATVLPLAPTNSAAPALSGTAQEGQILSSSSGSWTGSPSGYAYQWNRDGAAISGSINATRTLTSADVGHVLSCTVTATNAGGSTSATSAPSATVIAAAVPVPVNTVAPAASGSTTSGALLSSTSGTWSNSPTGYAYQWRRDGVDISGATASTYTLLVADASRSITCRVFATNAGGTAGATSNAIAASALVSSIDAKGWTGQFASTATLPAYSTGAREFSPDIAPLTIPLVRQGYSSTGTATTVNENLVIMRRVRQTYTGASNTHLLGSGNTVSLSGYAYATDTPPAGCTNNSSETSPLPVAQWQLRNRRVTGNSLYVELVAFHGSGAAGKPVAAVTANATDGTNTSPTILLTGPAILPSSTDKAAVIGYYGTIDVTTLNDGACQYNASVFPRIGASGSVLSSATGTLDARGFTPQSFYKSATSATKSKGIAPVYAYVDATSGSDTVVDANGATAGTTKVSTTAATASATPFASIKGALEALKAAINVTGGFTDGCIVRPKAGTYAQVNTAAGTYQSGGEVIVEADPAASAGSVTVTLATVSFRHLWVTYRNLALVRSGTGSLAVLSSSGRSAVVDCTLDNASQNSPFFTTGSVYVNGLTVTNVANSTLNNGTIAPLLYRGIVAGTPNGSAISVDGYNVTGCQFGNPAFVFGGRDPSGGVVAFTANLGVTGQMFVLAASTTGFAFVQNVNVFTATGSVRIMSISADGASANITHWIEWNNSYAGASVNGRHNMGYDELIGTYRAHKHWSQVGNIFVQRYTKHDYYIGPNGGASNAEAQLHVGGWPVLYQVGSRGNLDQFTVDTGSGPATSGGAAGSGQPNGDRNPADFGLSAKYSTTASYGRLDPLFAGSSSHYTTVTTAGVYTAGDATGVAADFQLQSGSPAKGMLTSAVLPFDFGGNARNATGDAAGAWA